MTLDDLELLRKVLRNPDSGLPDLAAVCERLLIEVMHQRILLVQLVLPMEMLSREISKNHLPSLDRDLAGELTEAAARLRAEMLQTAVSGSGGA